MFQSTLLRKERPTKQPLLHGILRFNPRSYERSDSLTRTPQILLICFNPRSYERSDTVTLGINEVADVSIHAPTKGATESIYFSITSLYVSIHAPTKGATRETYQRPSKGGCFNPRSYERSDLESKFHWIAEQVFQSTLLRKERLIFHRFY